MGIYLDNAATTKQKPQCVIDAVVAAMNNMGKLERIKHVHLSLNQWEQLAV